jgi:hypothetical protein
MHRGETSIYRALFIQNVRKSVIADNKNRFQRFSIIE